MSQIEPSPMTPNDVTTILFIVVLIFGLKILYGVYRYGKKRTIYYAVKSAISIFEDQRNNSDPKDK